MLKHIDVDTLRDWLARGRRVTVAVVRNDHHRGLWAIPGSVHVNAHPALKQGAAGANRCAVS